MIPEHLTRAQHAMAQLTAAQDRLAAIDAHLAHIDDMQHTTWHEPSCRASTTDHQFDCDCMRRDLETLHLSLRHMATVVTALSTELTEQLLATDRLRWAPVLDNVHPLADYL